MDLLARLQGFGAEVTRTTAVPQPFTWPPEKLVVGVSGGPDSLALLHALRQLWGAERLVLAHVNHGLRATAAAEAQFVVDTAVSWQIPHFLTTLDVAAQAQADGLSLEEAGRQARYRFFAAVATQVGAAVVATGHNADDQAETVLMHLLRGSGLAGLRGMEPAAPMPQAPHIWLVRPFLAVPRADIEQYCHLHKLQPQEDHSNLDTAFFRNRLRHHLLPLLADYNPQIKARLQNLAAAVAADEALLSRLQEEAVAAVLRERQDEWLAFDRKKWLALPLSLRRRTLRQMIWLLRPAMRDITFLPLEQACLLIERDEGSGQTALPGGLWLTVEYGRVLITTDKQPIPTDWPQLPHANPIPLPVPGRVMLENEWMLETAVVSAPDLTAIQANSDPWLAHVPQLGQPLYLRPRQPGEHMQPLGMNGQTVRLKTFMINRKIPAFLRARWPLVATANYPLWLVGHRLDERARVTTADRPVIQIRCYPRRN